MIEDLVRSECCPQTLHRIQQTGAKPVSMCSGYRVVCETKMLQFPELHRFVVVLVVYFGFKFHFYALAVCCCCQ